jgi:hypothetical protein
MKYQVKCDDSNNTVEDQEKGIVRATVTLFSECELDRIYLEEVQEIIKDWEEYIKNYLKERLLGNT